MGVTPAESKVQLRWPSTEFGGEIEYAETVVHSISSEAAVGLRKLKGGLEGGGLLFGERTAGLTRVLEARPVECEHRFGPSFVLSDTEQALLQSEVIDYGHDSKSLELLGYYFSHTRHGAILTDHEIELCNRHFPGRARSYWF